MDLLNDPSMKEIVVDFCKESMDLFTQLEDCLDILDEEPTNSKELESFGQIIDRVMGAAKSIGAEEIAHFCELGKIIGYKSSQISEQPLLEVVVAILFDAVDLLKKMITKLETGNANALQSMDTQTFVKRLKWLSDKFKDIDRASCTFSKEDEKKKEELSQNSIDDLLDTLGL